MYRIYTAAKEKFQTFQLEDICQLIKECSPQHTQGMSALLALNIDMALMWGKAEQ